VHGALQARLRRICYVGNERPEKRVAAVADREEMIAALQARAWRKALRRTCAIPGSVCAFAIWPATIRAQRLGPSRDDTVPVTRSRIWLIVALAIYLTFAITQGRGIGPLA
jgi:hypothetical protein